MKIQILSASIPGTAHTLPGSPKWKNNQDAYAFLELPRNECMAVVCDGCSSGEHSEVGAVLAAQHLVKLVATEVYMRNGALANIPWGQIKSRLISYLLSVAEGIDMEGDLAGVIENYFLFTIIGIIVTQKEIYIFYIGDGFYALDDSFFNLGPFPENSPLSAEAGLCRLMRCLTVSDLKRTEISIAREACCFLRKKKQPPADVWRQK